MIIYVAGAQRSATTALGQILSACDRTVLIGEVRPVLLDPGRHRSCDCGKPAEECDFWSRAGDEGERGLSMPARRAYRLTNVLRLAAALHWPSLLDEQDRRVVEHLRQVGRSAGDKHLIDTSKTPTGVLLWTLAGFEVCVVHVVRSATAVARAQAQPASRSGLESKNRFWSVLVWLAYHLMILCVRPVADRTLTVWFSRLLRTPRREVRRVTSALGLTLSGPEGDAPVFDVGPSHLRAGNPRRSRSGTVRVCAKR